MVKRRACVAEGKESKTCTSVVYYSHSILSAQGALNSYSIVLEEWDEFLQSGVKKLEELPTDLQEWPLETLKSRTRLQRERSPEQLVPNTLLLTRERQECLVCDSIRKPVIG